jgi:hypothetical protein
MLAITNRCISFRTSTHPPLYPPPPSPLSLSQTMAQRSTPNLIMSTLSPTTTSFSTFHSSTTTIPAKMTSHIIEYKITDAQLLLIGSGVGIRRAHHPVTSTSHALRMNYLSHPYPITAKHRTTAPFHLNLDEALYFNDLRNLASIFQEDPGQDIPLLHKVWFHSIP